MPIMHADITRYLKVQNIALRTLNALAAYIKPGMSEKDIALHCTVQMQKAGVQEWWYYNLPALVLVGERSVLSVSGRDYTPSDTVIRAGDLVTVDLSPQMDGCWGDCARTYVMGNPELEEGVIVEKSLHSLMRNIATPGMTLHALYTAMNAEIEKRGYKNLDFKGNLGHSIETDMHLRRYIEAGNKTKLGDLPLFTFEPHIREKNGGFGFKRENIYYFEAEKLIPLGDPELLDVL